MSEERLYTATEMAEMFEVSIHVVRRWLDRGNVRFVWVETRTSQNARRQERQVPHSAVLELIEQIFQVEGNTAQKELQQFRTKIKGYRRRLARKNPYDPTVGRYRNLRS